MTTQTIEKLVREAIEHKNIVDGKFDGTVSKIKNIIGANTSNLADTFFAGKEVAWTIMPMEDRLELMQHYIESEINNMLDLI